MPRCLSPVGIRDANKQVILVPCGKCANCIQNNWQQWIFRNMEELKQSKLGITVTLTYDDEHLRWSDKGTPTVKKRDIQLFLKKLRRRVTGSIKYMIVSEYGKNTYRPHYHGLLYFGHDVIYDRDALESIIQKTWNLGFIKFDAITDKSVAYTTKYLLKDAPQVVGSEPTWMLSSRRPAIGAGFIEENYKYFGQNKDKTYIQLTGGGKIGLPRYIKDKILKKRVEDRMKLVGTVTDIETILQEDIDYIKQKQREKDEREIFDFETLQLQMPSLSIYEYMQEAKRIKQERFEKNRKEHHKKETF